MITEVPRDLYTARPVVPTIVTGVEIDLVEAKLEGTAFQKSYDWEIRKRLLPQEILEASDASPEEINFLLGKTDVDPSPSHVIIYKELVDSGEAISIPQNVSPTQRLTPRIRLPKEKMPEGLTWRQRLAYELSNRPLTGDRLGSFMRQISLGSEVTLAMPSTQIASDLSWSEWEAIEGIKNSDGSTISDPHPDHLPTYRRLVPHQSPAQKETTVFEAVV